MEADTSIPLAFYAPKGEEGRERRKPRGRKPGTKNGPQKSHYEIEAEIVMRQVRGFKLTKKHRDQLEACARYKLLLEEHKRLGIGEYAPKPLEAQTNETPVEAVPEPEPVPTPAAEQPTPEEPKEPLDEL